MWVCHLKQPKHTTTRHVKCRRRRYVVVAAYLVLGLAFVGGCASLGGRNNSGALLPDSNIDRSGERLFSGAPFGIGSSNGSGQNCEWLKCPPWFQRDANKTASTDTATTPSAVPTGNASNTTSLPGRLTDPPSLMASTATASQGSFPGGFSGISSAIIMEEGRERAPFHPTASGGVARPVSPITGPAVVATPNEQIAPLGSEVVIVASYLGTGDHLITNEPIAWAIDGVGHIIMVDPGSLCDPFRADLRHAKKVNEKSATTKTSSVYQFLARGTPETTDDIQILRGQTWVSVNSTREGTSNLTVTGTSMTDWSRRSDRAIIHWVDAEWELPRTTIAAVGASRILTTTLRRKTDGSPRVGWVVRYEIIGGPAAALGDGAQLQEVVTNSLGQATVELRQTEMKQGTSTVAVSFIRPAGVDDGDKRITVGQETIRQTWASGGVLTVQTQGPRQIKRGEEANYTLVVTNSTGNATAALVWLPLAPTTQFVRSTPAPTSLGEVIRWELAPIPPQQSVAIPLTLLFSSPGDINVEAFVAPSQTPVPRQPVAVTPTPASTAPTTITPAPAPPAAATPYNTGTTPITLATTQREIEYRWERTDAEGKAINTPIRVGETIIYTLVVRNATSRALTNVNLRIAPPTNTRALKATDATAGTQRTENGTLIRTFESLPPDSTRQLQVRYQVIGKSYRETLSAEILIGNRSIVTPETTLAIVD